MPTYPQAEHRNQLPEQPQRDATFFEPPSGARSRPDQAAQPIHRSEHGRPGPLGQVAPGSRFQPVRLLGGAHLRERVLHVRRLGDLVSV